MSDAHRRPKTPDQTRRALLDAAARLALDGGLAAVSLPAVCAAAGVTKGALFHHFGSKQGLIAAVCDDLLTRIDAEVEQALAQDTGGRGSFTRAYLRCTFTPAEGAASPWSSLSLSAITDPGLAQIWAGWMARRLMRHAATDGFPDLEVVRLAADGWWLANLQGMDPETRSAAGALHARLAAMTRAAAPDTGALP